MLLRTSHMEINPASIIATGTWLHEGSVPCKVIVRKEEVPSARLNPADYPNAQSIACVSVWYENPGSQGSFNPGGAYYESLEAAQQAAGRFLPGSIEWGG